MNWGRFSIGDVFRPVFRPVIMVLKTYCIKCTAFILILIGRGITSRQTHRKKTFPNMKQPDHIIYLTYCRSTHQFSSILSTHIACLEKNSHYTILSDSFIIQCSSQRDRNYIRTRPICAHGEPRRQHMFR
jgi:hypothetical protein